MVKLIKYLLYIGKVSALKQAESIVKEASIKANVAYARTSVNSDNTATNYFAGQINAYDSMTWEIHKAIKNLEKEYKEG